MGQGEVIGGCMMGKVMVTQSCMFDSQTSSQKIKNQPQNVVSQTALLLYRSRTVQNTRRELEKQ